jgi:hypothetical protein
MAGRVNDIERPVGLIVQTVPRELVQVPPNRLRPLGALVAHAFKNRSKTLARVIRLEGCIFMRSIASGNKSQSNSDRGRDELLRLARFS